MENLFNYNWELCKLKEITERVKGNDGRMDLPTLTISAGQGWLNQKDRFSGNIAGKEQKNYTLLLKNELSYNHGNSKLAKYGAVFSLKTYEEALVPRVYHSFKSTKNSDPDFLEYIFATKKPDKELGKLVSSGARMDGLLNINYDDFSNIKINIPHIHEQKKISNLLRKIDNTITLHQRKLEQLKELKTAYLQVMFPAKDERVPKLRFAAFEDDWKLCKLGSILEERNEQMAENNEYYLMSFVQGKGVTPKGDRYDRSFLVKDEKKKYKKTEFGDFIYSSNNLERGSIGFNRTGKALISPVYSIFKSKNQLESQFIGILSERKSFINRMTKFRQGVVYGQWRIHESDFLNVEVRVPSHMEQKGIIKFFSNLDNMIIIHQNKLNQLKALKKAYLQNMFI
ncbi:restriction endonuclease subunit S [Enterococcus faecalis]|uniref:restriction endonuclease subunit S n=2 Tax=Enterococcus faecalis TaxID=1351 RepID=UPI00066673E4|nr:restriction endonuclease subunit S [Enterococcus faecalis]EHB6443082.1 restriction endonuclease subunit S [Enterococcus faecalis]EHF1088634.1 restriction endonuclease subunit S [Enterococcus faecalis]